MIPPAVARIFTDWRYFLYLAVLLLLGELVLNVLIIHYVPYTEIDWRAYMQEVEGYLQGEYDYTRLKGDTGPLVYPAGFVYIFAWLYKWTEMGINIRRAQYVFAALYSLNQSVVYLIYHKANIAPPFVILLLSLSKRYHSIYVLRLFNDPVALFLMHVCILALMHRRFALSSLFYSLALSVKMNILLFLPGFGLILLLQLGWLGALKQGMIVLFIQLLLGLPFLSTYPWSYLSRAFELSRVFMYKWTVNWKFLTESTFLSQPWAVVLLVMLLATWLSFAHFKFLHSQGGILAVLQNKFKRTAMPPDQVAVILFAVNFIGIVFSRTLHYQFYSWYFCSLPLLLWLIPPVRNPIFTLFIRLFLFVAIEYCWNVYPATSRSSLILLFCHVYILVGLWRGFPLPHNSMNTVKSKRK